MSTTKLHPVADGTGPAAEDSPATPPPAAGVPLARRVLAAAGRGAAAAWWRAVWPVLRSVAASPGWARAAELVSQRLRRARVQLCAVAALLVGAGVCWLTSPAEPLPAQQWVVAGLLGVCWWLAALLLAAGAAVLAVPLSREVYGHTVRGRVRGRYGVEGWASWWDLHRYLSASAVRRIAAATRPSLAAAVTDPGPDGGPDGGSGGSAGRVHAGRVEQLPVTECGTWLGRAVVGPVLDTQCYAAKRDVVGLLAPPQTGKTALLGHHVLDHRGPALVTSTKTDVYELCAGRRAVEGPVWLFNPENLGGLGSSVWWPLVRDCADPQVAWQRAGYLVAATAGDPDKGDDRWDEWATAVLRALLLAAALHGAEMGTVARWVFNPAREPRLGGAGEALAILQDAPDGQVPDGTAESLAQVLNTDARKTTDSIFLTLSRAVQFMTDPSVAALVTPTAGLPEFDIEAFLSGHATLFLVGSERANASTAPLLAAFTGHVFESAKQAAATRARGRLDPPLGLFLDEVALITPVPLERWIPDSGGRGIHLVWAVQSPSQLVARWGSSGADTIWNATNAKLVFGGFTLDEDLDPVSALCGYRHDTVRDPDGRERYERVRTCPPDRLRVLPEWHALLIHRSTPATIVRTSPAVWQRRDLLPAPPASAQQTVTDTEVPAAPAAA